MQKKKNKTLISRRNQCLNMPQLHCGGLSENWFLKELGDIHWSMITEGLNVSSNNIVDSEGDRLYASFVRLKWESNDDLSKYQENHFLTLEGKLSRFGAKSFFSEINCKSDENKKIKANLMSVFSKRKEGNNKQLEKASPLKKNLELIDVHLTIPKFGQEYFQLKSAITNQEVQHEFIFNNLLNQEIPLNTASIFKQKYTIDIYDDLNGVGLVYFASFPKISDKCEQLFFNQLITQDEGQNGWAMNSFTTARDILYFGNANPGDELQYSLDFFEFIDINKVKICSSIFLVEEEKLIAKIFTIKEINQNISLDQHRLSDHSFEIKESNQNTSLDQHRLPIHTSEIKETSQNVALDQHRLSGHSFEMTQKPITDHLTLPQSEIKKLLEKEIIQFLNACFGGSTIHVKSNLKHLGIESIVFLELSELITEKFHIKCNPSAFYGLTTIGDLIDSILEIKSSKKFIKNAIAEVSKNQEETNRRKEIAIIGKSFRLPEAENELEFWDLLKNGKTCIQDIPSDRFQWPDWVDVHDTQRGINKAGIVADMDKFDAAFFNISPKEAELLDPQQRMLLQLTWELIEKSGYSCSSFQKSKTGVFIGASGSDYELHLQNDPNEQFFSPTGTSLAILANRLSFYYDLDGPSIQIDTACSSSLTAIDLAVKSLRNGECEQAIVGAINLIAHPLKSLMYYNSNMLSKDGLCKTFDEKANGYVRGEGAVMLLLKPLKNALNDKDIIQAIIQETLINHGGHSNGLTVPDPIKQGNLLEEVYAKANIDFSTVSYIEVHGTATSLGDPIEILGLKKAFANTQNSTPTPWCGIGAVKTNIGHLEAAAGMAGIVKVLVCMENEQLPKNANFSQLNSKIELTNSPFYLLDQLTPWKGIDQHLRAGISSFGIGGTNGHIIIDAYPKLIEIDNATPSENYLFILSAKTAHQLKAYAKKMLLFCSTKLPINLVNLSYSLQVSRDTMKERLAIISSDLEELKENLIAFIEERPLNSYFVGIYEEYEENVELYEDINALLSSFFEQKKWRKMAKFWCKGAEINWNAYYKNSQPQKIEVPSYPFDKKSYWLPFIKKTANTQNVINPKKMESNRKVELFRQEWITHTLYQEDKITATTLLLVEDQNHPVVKLLQEKIQNLQVVEKTQLDTLIKNEDAFRTIEALVDLTDTSEVLDLYNLACIRLIQQLLKLSECKKIKCIAINYFDLITKAVTIHPRAGLYKGLQAEYAKVDSVHLLISKALSEGVISDHIIKELNQISPYTSLVIDDEIKCPKLVVSQDLSSISFIKKKIISGSVIITGGTKGLGMLCAKHLVKKYNVKHLLLIGREQLPTKNEWQNHPHPKVKNFLELESNGTSVTVSNVDLEDYSALSKEIELFTANGPISGILHCAGYMDFENLVFAKKELNQIRKLLVPKITGLINLHKVSEPLNLDFCLLFSSISSIIPELAASNLDYSMANAFMDNYAAFFQESKMKFKVVNWPSWKESGMGEITGGRYRKLGFTSLTNAEGLKILDIALSENNNDPIMPFPHFTDDFNTNTALQINPHASAIITMAMNNHTSETNQIEQNITSFKTWIREKLSQELKIPIDDIDDQTPFQEYGMDSVLLIQFVKQLEKHLNGAALSPSTIIEHPTIELLAAYFKTNGQELKNPIDFTGNLSEKITHPVTDPSDSVIHQQVQEKIAVIGMACHFPDAMDIATFWENLKNGKDSIKEVPKERWNVEQFYDPTATEKGKSYSKWGAFLETINEFDPEFFGISHELACQIDPLERQWLEVSVEAIADAGYDKKELWGKKIGVFAGSRVANFSDYIPHPTKDHYIATGQNFITSHLAHIYNFKGPTVVVDTACSSSISALHLAVQSILYGDSEMALAGGVDILLDEKPFVALSAAQVVSKDGKSKTFDENANGTGLGEGCGVLVLKKLSEAIKDGNKIYGVIDSTAINNDGNTMGVTTPNPKAQKELIEMAISRAKINPRSITYIETHGTGTAIGDPIELKGITEALSSNEKHFCGVGSVKTNIGHLLSAAGIAGVIKVLLSIVAKELPPSINCSVPNPRFDFKQSSVFLMDELKEWQGYERILRGGVSAFGLGGSNGHILLSNENIPVKNQVQLPLQASEIRFNKRICWPEKQKKAIEIKDNSMNHFFEIEELESNEIHYN